MLLLMLMGAGAAQSCCGGLYSPPTRTRNAEEVRREREAWGIIPVAARETIAKAAKVARPDDRFDVVRERVRDALRERELAYRTHYNAMLRAEIERIRREREDEETALAVLLAA